MASKTITFPVVSKGVRRNTETGVEVVAVHPEGISATMYEVRVADLTAYGYTTITRGSQANFSLATARGIAKRQAEHVREQIAEVYDVAARTDEYLAAADTDPQIAAEVAEANVRARKQFPSVFAILDAEQAPAALPEGVELIEFGTATPSGYVYMLSGVHVESMPKMEIEKRPRERVGRNGHRLAGWSVRIGGTEIDRTARKADARARLNRWLVEHLCKLGSAVQPERVLPPLTSIDAR